MDITRTSIISGIRRTQSIDITEEQYQRWERGEDLIQNCMPNTSPEEREFILTGVTTEEWDDEIPDDADTA